MADGGMTEQGARCWVLTTKDGGETFIEGVFSDEELATEAWEALRKTYGEDVELDEFPIVNSRAMLETWKEETKDALWGDDEEPED